MEKVNVMPLYGLGSAIGRLLTQCFAGSKMMFAIPALAEARSQLAFFSAYKQTPPLSAESAKGLLAEIESALPKADEQHPEPHLMTEDQANRLIYSIVHFQAVLATELPRANIFYTTPKRAYDMTLLINRGESILSPEALSALDAGNRDLVVQDIREATRSLAFDIPTAVGFHIFRAIETIIKKEYFPLLAIKAESNNLGQHINHLKAAEVDEKILGTLRNIKDYYRNPISHPEEFWDLDDAESALMLAVHAITVILQDISTRMGQLPLQEPPIQEPPTTDPTT
ncbi:hypothetical protein [Desulfoferula mesophila]|uniref:DUF4145 domain-containing protein n=1 Tax=Desulfoferula mesophila TaxID=3058419 RepID=A0AAU9EIY2_9BACT|nr:hypothetical protein FAK_40840 [Desulfoferula mesophilus]